MTKVETDSCDIDDIVGERKEGPKKCSGMCRGEC